MGPKTTNTITRIGIPHENASFSRALRWIIRDLVWAMPIALLLLVIFGPAPMVVFAVAGGTIRAFTIDMGSTFK
ncbi:MAG: hypothetical protein OXH51_09030 [Gemmatimonadetes bacterium]|nr:hypothetical protein [Gemmatimonadota bacterium]MCY3611665.1 hypothetical protein [Gemmatimonadota bacterium]MCY3678702.1 hypothetical protein [Gemmatimonadota bacterium]MYA41936.1 hypothetical protein [Gemmatimonadota bacterium]MYE93961.1 hypothetical protein [Gemmatimonadota bacterium]